MVSGQVFREQSSLYEEYIYLSMPKPLRFHGQGWNVAILSEICPISIFSLIPFSIRPLLSFPLISILHPRFHSLLLSLSSPFISFHFYPLYHSLLFALSSPLISFLLLSFHQFRQSPSSFTFFPFFSPSPFIFLYLLSSPHFPQSPSSHYFPALFALSVHFLSSPHFPQSPSSLSFFSFFLPSLFIFFHLNLFPHFPQTRSFLSFFPFFSPSPLLSFPFISSPFITSLNLHPPSHPYTSHYHPISSPHFPQFPSSLSSLHFAPSFHLTSSFRFSSTYPSLLFPIIFYSSPSTFIPRPPPL